MPLLKPQLLLLLLSLPSFSPNSCPSSDGGKTSPQEAGRDVSRHPGNPPTEPRGRTMSIPMLQMREPRPRDVDVAGRSGIRAEA